jgi:hypothetical protein
MPNVRQLYIWKAEAQVKAVGTGRPGEQVPNFGRRGIEFWKVTSWKLAVERVSDFGRVRGLDWLSSAAWVVLVVPSVEGVSDHDYRHAHAWR